MHTYKKLTIGLSIVFALGLSAALVLKLVTGGFASAAVYSTANGAIDGVDAVSYFESGSPRQGSKLHSMEYLGAIWLFSSEENLTKFREDPERYVPAYGGYCAYAVSEGYTAYSDPYAWEVVDEKLYLNYDAEVKAMWQVNAAERIDLGDRNWPTLEPALQQAKYAHN